MLKLNCPSCGGEVQLKSKASVFAVCSYCRSSLVRHDMNMELYGKVSELQDDMTSLQVGTTGVYDGRYFELLGRYQIGWSDGFWNEWYARFDNDGIGWLAEAQGFYAMNIETPAAVRLPSREAMSVGEKVVLKPAVAYIVDDIKQASCIGSEGELPFPAVRGNAYVCVDLTGPEGEYACIEYNPDGARVFFGQYVDFDDFRFKRLREIDGW